MSQDRHLPAGSTPGFALISVLALVSLAALSATAFLASARLQSQANRSLYNTTILEMALHAGACAAHEMLDYGPSQQFDFVTAYWRGTNSADWTNELGYLLNGGAIATNPPFTNTTNCFYACFSTATFTNLSNSASALVWVSNRVSQQGNFISELSAFMQAMTNFAPGQSTNIPMLGGATSPPVGWVYIKQDVRIRPGFTNTTNIPVVRFAFYVQDLGGLIDAQRMGGSPRTSGTNPSEISLSNAIGTSLTTNANFVLANNRPKYLTPGLLLRAGGLATNDLRYVATGLWAWTNAYARIPMGLGYDTNPVTSAYTANTNSRFKINLNEYFANGVAKDANVQSNIAFAISNNIKAFTNRAGGMNPTNYLYSIAANLIDYVDANPSATCTNTNGITIAGFDNYPVLTQLFDQFVCTQSGNAPPTITVNTYLQFWNPASIATVETNYTLSYDFADTIKAAVFTNASATNTNSLATPSRMTALVTTNLKIPSISPNGGYITNFVTINNLNIPNTLAPAPPMDWTNFRTVWINTNSGSPMGINVVSNSIAIQVGAVDILRLRNGFYRGGLSMTNGETTWSGVVLGLRGQGVAGVKNQSRLMADPRMHNFTSLTNGYFAYPNVYWGGYPAETTDVDLWGNPGLWPDGTNSTTNLVARGTRYAITNPPTLGPFSIPDPTPCNLSTNSGFLRITELGNIFDPMQWLPAAPTTNYANCNIAPGTWSANQFAGGGATLRIGRPEHSLFAFTNFPGANTATPNMQSSAAALLDIFCTESQYDEGGRVNLNTAPAPVLRALAGGVILSNDPVLGNVTIPPAMAEAFAQGVMRFRHRYPFYSPSQLCFIGTSPTWPGLWPNDAVFGNRGSIPLDANAPGNSFGSVASNGVSAWNDQTAEEWFAKIFSLSTTQSRNFRCYVIAQRVSIITNGGTITTNGIGPVMRKYYNIFNRQNNNAVKDTVSSCSTYNTYESPY